MIMTWCTPQKSRLPELDWRQRRPPLKRLNRHWQPVGAGAAYLPLGCCVSYPQIATQSPEVTDHGRTANPALFFAVFSGAWKPIHTQTFIEGIPCMPALIIMDDSRVRRHRHGNAHFVREMLDGKALGHGAGLWTPRFGRQAQDLFKPRD